MSSDIAELDDPLLAWMHFESFVNDGSPSGFSHEANIPTDFRPSEGRNFDVTVFAVDEMSILRSGPRMDFTELASSWDSRDRFLIVHPLALEMARLHPLLQGAPSFTISARATSSVRTVWILNDTRPVALVKLHVPRTIGRYVRDIRLHTWISSIENSHLLSHIVVHSELVCPPSFAFLSEGSGSYLECDGDARGFGHIERALTPTPASTGRNQLIPYFSLWSKDASNRELKPMLAVLIAKFGWSYEDVFARVIAPLFEGYAFLALRVGLIPECNAQNVLLEVDCISGSTRVVHRDLMGFFKDLDHGLLQDVAQFPMNGYHTIGRGVADTELRRSFAFDFKLGQYVLDPLVHLIAGHFGIPVDKVAMDCKDLCRSMIRWPIGYFPPDGLQYGYPNQPLVGRSRYVSLDVPRYR